MKYYLFIGLLLFSIPLFGQFTTVIPEGFVAGNASVATTDFWIPFHNPATLTNEEKGEIGVSYENRYFAPELSNAMLFGVIPTPYFQIGLSYSFFGYSVYNEMLSAITLARRFGNFTLGIACDYYTLFVSQSEGYRGALTAQVGCMVDIGKQFTLGFSCFNPIFSKLKTIPESRLPVLLALGANYKFYRDFEWLIEIEKEISSPIRIATGIEYKIVDALTVGLGVSVRQQVSPNLVVHCTWGGLNFHIQSGYYYPLGFVLSAMLSYRFI